MSRLCFWLSVFLSAGFLPLQAQDWLTAYNESVAAYNQGNLQNAYTLGKEALSRYQQQGDRQHANYMAVLQAMNQALLEGHLAEALYGAGQPDEAVRHFAAAMQVLDSRDNVPADYLSFCYSYGSLLLPISTKYLNFIRPRSPTRW